MAWLDRPIVLALGWTIVHSLWQGAILAAGYYVLASILRRSAVRIRYALGIAVLVLLLGSSIFTFLSLSRAGISFSGQGQSSSNEFTPHFIAMNSPGPLEIVKTFCIRHAPLIAFIWLIGVILLSLRLFGGWVFTRRIRRAGSRAISGALESRLQRLCRRAQCKIAVQLRESIHVHIPLTLGHFKPIIFFPVGLLIGLPPEEAEALLAHELAHILRRDYLFNLLQSLVDILYFYHPAVYWISGHIRQEREHCCDDLATSLTGNPDKMALALVKIHTWKGSEPVLAQCASGKRHQLLYRIRRLLKMNTNEPSILRTSFWTLLSVLLIGGAIFSLQAASKNEVSSQPIVEPLPIVAPSEIGNPSREKEVEKQRALVDSIRKEVEQMQAEEARLNPTQKQNLQALRLKLLGEEKILRLLEGNRQASDLKRVPAVPPAPEVPASPPLTALPELSPLPEPAEIEEIQAIAESELAARAHELEAVKEEARQHLNEAERARIIEEEHARLEEQLKQEAFDQQRFMQERLKVKEKSRLANDQKRMMKEKLKMEEAARQMELAEMQLQAKEIARQKLDEFHVQKEVERAKILAERDALKTERLDQLNQRLKQLEERLSALAAALESFKNQQVTRSEKK